MFEIARGWPHRPVSLKEVSRRQDVSVAYLEQLLGKLRRAGLVVSVKGPGGGYLLSRPPERISIGSILKELEGPVALTACVQDPRKGCVRVEGCVTSLLWRALGQRIEQFLDTITLADLLNTNALRRQVRKEAQSA
jgi:Rrf2 family iron-sulfur cluster assembly transcriptional regulator